MDKMFWTRAGLLGVCVDSGTALAMHPLSPPRQVWAGGDTASGTACPRCCGVLGPQECGGTHCR